MSEVVIEFKFLWQQSDGDCSKCNVCEEPIYGKMQTLVVSIGEKKEETEFRICQPCFELASESK